MLVLLILLLVYCLLITILIYGFVQIPNAQLEKHHNTTSFSILIPFRNEQHHLTDLLASINALHYPKDHYEVLLIDDASTDNSVALIQKFAATHKALNIQIYNNVRSSNSPKKDALSMGVQKAQYDWVITTDADCILPHLWLKSYSNKITQNPRVTFIAGPVAFWNTQNVLLDGFQHLDFLSLQGATIGGFGIKKPFMCNGANLAFAKAKFIDLQGYQNLDHIASGDDIFLMQKFVKNNPDSVTYLKNRSALVRTAPQTTLKGLINQRRRWAAKASHYKITSGIVVSWIVFLGNLVFILGFFFYKTYPYILLKLTVDFILLWVTAAFTKQQEKLINFPWTVIFYPIFTVYIAISSTFIKFEWKGRQFKK